MKQQKPHRHRRGRSKALWSAAQLYSSVEQSADTTFERSEVLTSTETEKRFEAKLTALIRDSNKKLRTICKESGVPIASLSKYQNGDAKININSLVKIADYFNVSCDYLLRGVTAENINAHKDLGLSQESIDEIMKIKQTDTGNIQGGKGHNRLIDTVNRLIESEDKYRILSFIGAYLFSDEVDYELSTVNSSPVGINMDVCNDIILNRSFDAAALETIRDTLVRIKHKERPFKGCSTTITEDWESHSEKLESKRQERIERLQKGEAEDDGTESNT
jgi:transcriptional regulator with XRE-family HTH domain